MSGARFRAAEPPEEMANVLLALQAQVPKLPGSARGEDSQRLDWALRTACGAGWSSGTLARVLGVSPQSVRQRVARAHPVAGFRFSVPSPTRLSSPPPPPRKQSGPGRPVTSTQLSEQTAQLLRELQTQARKTVGWHPPGHPSRVASEQLSALLAALVADGVTVYRLAKTMGVTHAAVTSRLQRHGYRDPSPSLVRHKYTGGHR